ncbi:helix-turn-helix transcriptional regulator [Colwellia sp. D2M02]|uniref:helix-turn-helix domain-containing protein n=1 Tax=Colwellia sp. D2M02 TaxID=2841562 RepID=UPI001C08C913|nr:helix-turn-helix transcriptional regulator [Colwellia sp. D2M02]MBU2894933.1 helix-turn-helix transcriptional regulator [Colwellia sp. D2M02]
MKLADKLILLRKEKGWTQAIAAKNIAIQQSYLSKLENGHYQPSNDVIEKLCLAYDVPINSLINQLKAKPALMRYLLPSAIVSATLGVMLLLNGYFALIFPQAYYTYKAQVVSASEKSLVTLNYHLTDNYQGDKYIEEFAGVKYEYTLLSTREIKRAENRWLMSIGSLLLIIAFSLYCYFRLKNSKTSLG